MNKITIELTEDQAQTIWELLNIEAIENSDDDNYYGFLRRTGNIVRKAIKAKTV